MCLIRCAALAVLLVLGACLFLTAGQFATGTARKAHHTLLRVRFRMPTPADQLQQQVVGDTDAAKTVAAAQPQGMGLTERAVGQAAAGAQGQGQTSGSYAAHEPAAAQAQTQQATAHQAPAAAAQPLAQLLAAQKALEQLVAATQQAAGQVVGQALAAGATAALQGQNRQQPSRQAAVSSTSPAAAAAEAAQVDAYGQIHTAGASQTAAPPPEVQVAAQQVQQPVQPALSQNGSGWPAVSVQGSSGFEPWACQTTNSRTNSTASSSSSNSTASSTANSSSSAAPANNSNKGAQPTRGPVQESCLRNQSKSGTRAIRAA